MASPSYNQSHFINLRDERLFRKAFNLTRPLLLRRVFYVEHMLKFLQAQEPQTFTLLKRVLSEACGREDATFVDSGANDGAWSLVAASYGCKVIAVEPQPMCTRFLQEGVDANTWLDGRIKVFNAFLSPKPMSATLKDDVCHGIRTVLPNGDIGVSNSHAKGDFKGRGKDVVVKSSTLGELLPAHDRVAFWHVDVEGAELSVLDSAASLFAERRVDHVMLELIPARWKPFGVTLPDGLERARRIFEGWSCVRMCDGAAYNFSAPPVYVHSTHPRHKCQPDIFCRSGIKIR